ncbi:MAG TPA: hypothetical protein VK745_26805, partial [Polyangiaceae bacterium]|nr:hypothetical protein [Polyangiaceae bacterium]
VRASRADRDGGSSQLALLAASFAMDFGLCGACSSGPRGVFLRPRIGTGPTLAAGSGRAGWQVGGEFGLGYQWSTIEFEALTLLDQITAGDGKNAPALSFGGRIAVLQFH